MKKFISKTITWMVYLLKGKQAKRTQPRKKINWLNTLFLAFCPIVGIGGTLTLLLTTGVQWQSWVLAGVFTFLTGIGITAGYHRLLSHSTYKTNKVIKTIFLLLGGASFEGSVFEWSSDHRNHHRYADTEKDPYNINEGFWHAHMGWLIHLDTSKRDFSNIKDLTACKVNRFQHKHYVLLSILVGFIMPTLIAWCWGAPLAGLLIAGALRISFNHHMTFFINSLCHTMGKQNYSKEQTARDHWLTAVFTYGEGFHNFHHKFPIDYRNGIRAFHYDPAKWLIFLLSKLGLASGLKRVSSHRIARYQLQSRETTTDSKLHPMIQDAKNKVVALVQHLESLEKEYVAHIKTAAKNNPPSKILKAEIRKAKRELRKGVEGWLKLTRLPLNPLPA